MGKIPDKTPIENVIPDMNTPIPFDEKSKGTGSYMYREPEIFGVTMNDWRRSVERAWSESDPNRIDLAAKQSTYRHNKCNNYITIIFRTKKQ